MELVFNKMQARIALEILDEVKEEPVVVTTKDVMKDEEDSSDYFIEEEDEEDFLRDLSRAHRRMNSR